MERHTLSIWKGTLHQKPPVKVVFDVTDFHRGNVLTYTHRFLPLSLRLNERVARAFGVLRWGYPLPCSSFFKPGNSSMKLLAEASEREKYSDALWIKYIALLRNIQLGPPTQEANFVVA